MRHVAVTTVVCLLAVVSAPAGDAPPGGKHPEPTFLVVSTRTGNPEIFLVNPRWGDARNLSRHKAADLFPAWSADGNRVAFISDRDGRPNVYVMGADGTGVKQLTHETGANDFGSCPSWSPDGKQIAYCRFREADYAHTVVMDADGGNAKSVRENGWDPAWSPDGKKIAFTAWIEKGFKVCVMDPDGANVKTFPTNDNDQGSVYPAWSPDGKKIAYADLSGGSLEIHVCDSDGTNITRLTGLGGSNTGPAWSPDGKAIAFQHGEPTGSAIFLVDPDGSNVREVIPLREPSTLVRGNRPAWRPK